MKQLIEIVATIETASKERLCGRRCLYLSEKMSVAQTPRGFCNLIQASLLLTETTRQLRWDRCTQCKRAPTIG